MRVLLTGGLVLLLAGCAGVYGNVVQSVRKGVLDRSPLHFTAKEVYGRPYYQMRLDWRRASSLMIMGDTEHGRELWYDGNGDLFVLQHGLVVKTANLPADLAGTRLSDDDPFRRGLQHLQGTVHCTRRVDVMPGYRYGVPVEVTLTPAGMTTLTILGTRHAVRIVDETLDAPLLHFSAHNRYWVDPASGVVWQSRQTLPSGETLNLTTLRPYTGDAP